MHPELDAALVRDFPHLYRDRHGDTRMCDGFPNDGWEPLIRRLSEKLEPIARETGLKAAQVKEKMGGLRFYLRDADDARVLPHTVSKTVRSAIGAAEKESRRTCEHCGAAGSRSRVEGWWLTLCTACLEREQARRAERKRRFACVWLDDVREAPAGWTRAYTAREAIAPARGSRRSRGHQSRPRPRRRDDVWHRLRGRLLDRGSGCDARLRPAEDRHPFG